MSKSKDLLTILEEGYKEEDEFYNSLKNLPNEVWNGFLVKIQNAVDKKFGYTLPTHDLDKALSNEIGRK